jgi:hypothetical protein
MSQALRTPPAPRVAAEIEQAVAPYRQQPPMLYAEIERLAASIAKSGLFGIKTQDQAIVLMMIASAEGMHPVLAARDYDVIQGRPAKKAEAMLRDFLNSRGSVEWHALSDEIADATFAHPQGGKARITWDMPRAVAAGLAGKDTWKKFPRQMLRSRTVSEGVRTIWPMATGGMYVTEEAQDMPADPFRGHTLEHEPAAPVADPSPPPPPPASTPPASTQTNGNGHEAVSPNNRVWLDNMRKKLATTDRDTVVKIGGLRSVTEALAHASDVVKAELNEMLADAYAACDKAEADAAEAAEAQRWVASDDGEIENDPTLGGVVPDELATPPSQPDKNAAAAADLIAQIKAARDPRAVERVMSGMIATALLDRFDREHPELAASIREAAAARTAELRAGGG